MDEFVDNTIHFLRGNTPCERIGLADCILGERFAQSRVAND
jgi:hypothetical protein